MLRLWHGVTPGRRISPVDVFGHNGVMGNFLIRWFILTIAAAVMVVLLPGMHVVGHPPILGIAAFSLFMALFNASLKPVVQMLALPFSVLTFGLLALVINWLFMELASWLAYTVCSYSMLIQISGRRIRPRTGCSPEPESPPAPACGSASP